MFAVSKFKIFRGLYPQIIMPSIFNSPVIYAHLSANRDRNFSLCTNAPLGALGPRIDLAREKVVKMWGTCRNDHAHFSVLPEKSAKVL